MGARNCLDVDRARLREAWCAMIKRCHDPGRKDYQSYGGRGIIVCERWRDSFEAFLEDMGRRPTAAHTLERVNNDGPYCKENCRWSSRKEQANNTRRNRRLTLNGLTLTQREWSQQTGISEQRIYQRLKIGWPVERALTESTERTY